MASRKTQFTVGLFVLAGMTVIALLVIWVGVANFLDQGSLYAAYFDESVQGLNKDSPVKYRGVSIGRVASIGVAPDAALIQVILQIDPGTRLVEDGQVRIESDLVARLKSVGITGIMFVELDRKKGSEPGISPRIDFPAKYPVIETRPSDVKQIFEGINEVLQQMKAMDLEGVTQKMKANLDILHGIFVDADVKGLAGDIRSTFNRAEAILDPVKWNEITDTILAGAHSLDAFSRSAVETVDKVNRAVTRIDRVVQENETELGEAMAAFKTSARELNRLIQSGTGLVENADARLDTLESNLLQALQNLKAASENLNRLAEMLSDQPSQLIFGEPPPSRKFRE